MDEYKLWNRIWDDTIPFTTDDIIELLHVKFMPSEERQKNPFCGTKSEIKDATLVDLEDYLVKEIKEYLADGSDEVLRDFYRELISSELSERPENGRTRRDIWDYCRNITPVLHVPTLFLHMRKRLTFLSGNYGLVFMLP